MIKPLQIIRSLGAMTSINTVGDANVSVTVVDLLNPNTGSYIAQVSFDDHFIYFGGYKLYLCDWNCKKHLSDWFNGLSINNI